MCTVAARHGLQVTAGGPRKTPRQREPEARSAVAGGSAGEGHPWIEHGVQLVGGLWRGLSHEDAARFAFLLATPVILAAGVLKLPSLAGSAGDHIHGQVAVGFVICGITAYISIRFLVKYFETKTLTPFAIYSLIVGLLSVAHFA